MSRHITIEADIADFDMLLYSLNYQDQLGKPFNASVSLVSKDLITDYNDFIGKKASLKLVMDHGVERFINGFFTAFSYYDHHGEYYYYQATIQPWLSLLEYKTDCRIFQNQTVPEIVSAIFQEHGYTADLRLTDSYTPRVFCVQYRENQLNFVNRLLEEEGIYYSFTHSDADHQLVLFDHQCKHDPCEAHEALPYHPSADNSLSDSYFISQWYPSMAVQSGSYALTDYNYKQPRSDLAAISNASQAFDHSTIERYDYPGSEHYTDNGGGDRYAKIRLEEHQCRINHFAGSSDSGGIEAGQLLTLTDHPNSEQNQAYLITGTSLKATVAGFQGGPRDSGPKFSSSIQAIPESVQFRPVRIANKPLVHGPETAVVVGPEGEEIYHDDLGRIKVQFHWDRVGEKNQDSTCYVRVAQAWAGQQWGASFVPRIGHEVMIEFLGGNPDNPVVTGSLYNGANPPPYSSTTQSGIKSRSTKGGTPDNFNEIRFDDAMGEEQVYIHAEKNQDNIVENNETTDVGNDRTENIGNNETITIGNDRTENVGNNEDITIGTNRTEKVGSNESIAIGSNRTETVGSNETVTVKLLRTHNVGVNDMLNVGGANEVTVGGFRATTVGLYQARTTGLNLDENVGKVSTHTAGDKIHLETGNASLTMLSDGEITLKNGGTSLNMKNDGTIKLNGKDITINGKGKGYIKFAKNLTMKAKKILQNK